jgi:hypothetical protein
MSDFITKIYYAIKGWIKHMSFINAISRAVRDGGEYNSPNFTVPSNIKHISIALNLQAVSAFATPDKSLTIVAETSNDGAATWQTQFQVGWVGGAPSPKSGGWTASIDGIQAFAGQLVRLHVSQSGSFRWGLNVEIDR